MGILSTVQRAIARTSRDNPVRLLLLGYASYIAIAWILLCLPLTWRSEAIGPLDNLFIATSAVSTTGLITVNTPEAYNFWGQLVIFLAFQIGGIGYMTLSSFVLVARKTPLSYTRRQVSSSVFSLPEGFELRPFIRHVVFFTIIAEVIGSVLLYIFFRLDGVEEPLWPAIFHAVSAFCTAGFSVFPNSLEDFRANLGVNIVVSILSILGAIGFLVISDLWLTLRRRRSGTTLTTRLIIWFTACLLSVGFLLLLFLDESLFELPWGERILAAWFQAMTALTTVGFNTQPIGVLGAASVLLILILMIVGASPSGTGGGLKSTSISAGLAVMWSALRGRDSIALFGRRIPEHRIFTAFAAWVFYLIVFLAGATCLLALQSQNFEDVVFEAASALGTVGLSRGITGDLTPLAKIATIALMYVGRVGALSFGIALFHREAPQATTEAQEDLAI